jgi:hypothetical protein
MSNHAVITVGEEATVGSVTVTTKGSETEAAESVVPA